MKYCYNRNLYVKPFYEGNIVYYETAMFIGEEDVCSLAFPIKKVKAVLDYGLQLKYEEGRDYKVVDGHIQRLIGSRIPYFKPEEYYLEQPNNDQIRLRITNEKLLNKYPKSQYFLYGETLTFTSHQIAIIYEHENKWNGSMPVYQGEKVSKFINKLKNKEKATLLFFGDSITFGCNSSGTEMGGNTSPYAEMYPKMVHGFLESKFHTKINYVNTSVGGKNTCWALETVEENVNFYNPDLVVLAFGMNDGGRNKEYYAEWLNEIINKMMSKNPNLEIVVVSPTVANVDSDWFAGQEKFIDVINKINLPNVVYVDMTNVHLDLIKAGKKFGDMTGNNVNHPNDFLARIYAQFILKTIIK